MRVSTKSVAALVAALVLFAGWAGFAQVQDKPKQKPATSSKKGAKQAEAGAPAAGGKDSAGKSSAEAAIRQGAAAFVEAYNAHDAKAVSELFAHKAEFTDEDGNLIKGREQIEADFARMFEKNADCRIAIEIDSIRVLTPSIAVEEGVVRGQPSPDDIENVSRYVAVHVNVDSRWVIASVSDFEGAAVAQTAHDHLQELAWMVGDWIDESSDSAVKSSCRWDDSGNYLLHEFVLHVAGQRLASGSMRIGSDPVTGQFKSWTFDADSGYSEGLWTSEGDEWIVKAHGVNGRGQVTSSTNVFRYIDNDTMTWRSYDRVVGGEPAESVAEFVVKRQAPVPSQ